MMKVSKRLFSLLLIGAFMFSLFGFKEFNSVKALEVSASGDSDGCNNRTESQTTSNEGQATLNEGQATLNEGQATLNEGQATLNEGQATYIATGSDIATKDKLEGVALNVEGPIVAGKRDNNETEGQTINRRSDIATKGKLEGVAVNVEVPTAAYTWHFNGTESQTTNRATGSESLTLPLSTNGTLALQQSIPQERDIPLADELIGSTFTVVADNAPLAKGISPLVTQTVEAQALKETATVKLVFNTPEDTINRQKRLANIKSALINGGTETEIVAANEGKLPKVYNRAAIGDLRNYGSQKSSNSKIHDDDYLLYECTAFKKDIASQAVQSYLAESTTIQNGVLDLLQ